MSVDLMSENSTDPKSLLYIFSKAPYSHSSGQETLDAVLIGASFEQDISVLFIHDGIYQLHNNQSVADTDLKQYSKTFAALADFDVDKIYVHEPSSNARGVSIDDLMINVQPLDTMQVSKLIADQFRVFHL